MVGWERELERMAERRRAVELAGGATNMFGACPYLMDEFLELTRKEATEVLTYWMKTFAQENR